MNRQLARQWILAPALAAGMLACHSATASGFSSLPPFSFVDEDGDRRISRTEARKEPALRDSFDALDADRNGALTRLEYLDAGRLQRQERASMPGGSDRTVDLPLSGTLLH